MSNGKFPNNCDDIEGAASNKWKKWKNLTAFNTAACNFRLKPVPEPDISSFSWFCES
jgi:hypothetical protein